MISPLFLLQALCAALCIYGYFLVGGPKARLGYLLSGIGSAGWLLASSSIFFQIQSLFFLVVSAMGYERARQSAAK